MANSVDYVSFECTHFAESNQCDPDERETLVYADIDGYPADENAEGTVICRVWMLKETDQMGHRKYLVNWHQNAYRANDEVLKLVRQAKDDLKKYFEEDLIIVVFKDAYERYKLQWMIDHGYSFADLLPALQEQLELALEFKEEDSSVTNLMADAFAAFERDAGFSGAIWACENEFSYTEWEDEDYMRKLLTDKEFGKWREVQKGGFKWSLPKQA